MFQVSLSLSRPLIPRTNKTGTCFVQVGKLSSFTQALAEAKQRKGEQQWMRDMGQGISQNVRLGE